MRGDRQRNPCRHFAQGGSGSGNCGLHFLPGRRTSPLFSILLIVPSNGQNPRVGLYNTLGNRKVRYMRLRSTVMQVLIIFAAPASSYAGELKQQALAAWDNYLVSTKLRMQERLAGKSPFLWVDEDPRRKQHLD